MSANPNKNQAPIPRNSLQQDVQTSRQASIEPTVQASGNSAGQSTTQENMHGNMPPAGQMPPVYYLPAQSPEPDDEINLMDYWRILMRFKWLIMLLTVISGAATIGVAYQMTPIFKAETLLAPAGEDKGAASALAGQFGGLAALAGINIGSGGGEIEAAVATLNSRSFTNAFIKQENLMPVLFADLWDADSNKWLVENEKDLPTEWKAYKLFNNGIRSINVDKKTGMYSLSIEWSDPELAALWANKLVDRINAHQKKQAIIEAKKSIAYLENQLQETSVLEMQQAIYRLIEAQTKI